MQSFINWLRKTPVHFILVGLFFLSNGHRMYFGLIPLSDSIVYFLILSFCAAILFYIFRIIVKESLASGILTTFCMGCFLFYGVLQDFFKERLLVEVFSRYRVLLPVMAAIVIGLMFIFKRNKTISRHISFYLNCLFIFYILADLAVLGYKTVVKSKELLPNAADYYNNFSLQPCTDCPTPDIYLLVLDEYSGSITLKNNFGYDNTPFENRLKAKGFFVAAQPFSNYSSTPISMASLFEMKYNSWMLKRKSIVVEDYTRAAAAISNSSSLRYLQMLGYRFYNYSIFDIQNQPSLFNTGLLKIKLQLITDKTLWNRMQRDLGWQLHENGKWNWLAILFNSNYREGNKRLLELTREQVVGKKEAPQFIYTHLMMPHGPFLYDSLGKVVKKDYLSPSALQPEKEAAYIQYLVYTNKIVEQLVDDILQKTNRKAVIIVMSDHGFRGWDSSQSCFKVKNNLNAVYLPSGNYRLFKDSVSNVNQFRILFNSLFNQKLDMLPDSCVN